MDGKRDAVLTEVTDRPLSGHAVRWAADEAALRRLPLRLLHVRTGPASTPPDTEPGSRAHSWATHLHARGETLLREARDQALHEHPELEVTTEPASGRPARVLREAAASASLLVLAAPRHAGADSFFAPRDEADALAGHLPCPVALVREPPSGVPDDAPVVVGADGPPPARAAVDLAFEEAFLRGVGLVAVLVRGPRDAGRAEVLEETRVDLSESLAGHRERYPGVEVRQDVVVGDPAAMLALASRDARCLVIGAHGRGGLRTALLGSTGRTLIHGTYCPLIIAPAPSAR
ncbi:universal stress protein [Streptomyces sp. UNOB3_S3]|uniref:universal stress protein n=1 Tax=Streptomyces sp. UNOB3_S3 TaxID=2871682 RepID=UPI001E2EEDE1|nr:universal stress protein [Streptomyces sp. UNOB3_S3]MCC3777287.1 universal stress protein [Streptomyces sp. UNOB3_S3]